MKLMIVKQYNELTGAPKLFLLKIEETDIKPICRYCGKEIMNKEQCWFNKDTKWFNCKECVVDAKIQNIFSGYKISKLADNGYNALPVIIDMAQ